jgi:hypothetical protein
VNIHTSSFDRALAINQVVVGTCRICGCRDDQVCELESGDACFWLDRENTLCSNPRCIALVPLAELELLVVYRDLAGNEWKAGEDPRAEYLRAQEERELRIVLP